MCTGKAARDVTGVTIRTRIHETCRTGLGGLTRMAQDRRGRCPTRRAVLTQ